MFNLSNFLGSLHKCNQPFRVILSQKFLADSNTKKLAVAADDDSDRGGHYSLTSQVNR